MAAYFPNLREENISLFMIPIFWGVAIAPRLWASAQFRKYTKNQFDSRQPREFVKVIEESQALDAATKGRLRRAEAAGLNAFENFGVFAAAVTAGSAARLDPAIMNGTTIAYLVSRAVYAYIYVNNESQGQARVRAVVFIGGLGLLCSLFVQAGLKLKDAVP